MLVSRCPCRFFGYRLMTTIGGAFAICPITIGKSVIPICNDRWEIGE